MRNIILLCLLTVTTSFSQNNSDGVQPFLEAIVSQFPNVRDTAISPDNTEVIFTVQSLSGDVSALVMVKKTEGKYSEPKLLPFSGQFSDMEPFFSEDGHELYFVSNRPLDSASNEPKDYDIWFVTRESLTSKWSEPRNIGAPVNTLLDEFYPAITTSGNLYFTLDDPSKNEKDNIYVSKFSNGTYSKPEALGPAINSKGYEFNAFVSPEEKILIYTCYNREDGHGSGDLYISYSDQDGNWSKAKNMGDVVNSSQMDYCPFLDRDNTLYFTSRRFDSLQNTSKKRSLSELKDAINSYSNGLSRLYTKSMKLENKF
ncbi:MAG: hypothetical protein HKP28_03325 [Winogradskyella sp.]|nr:hypothetical protein [Winogradskyella sp.]